jgi:hypothetical protein
MSHTFTFETTICRGRNEREYQVAVTYTVTPGCPARLYGDYPHPAEDAEIEVIKAVVLDGDELTEAEWEQIQTEAEADAVDAIADEYAEAAEYRAEQRADQLMHDRWAA